MNNIPFIICLILMSALVTACGVKLFDMGSGLISALRRHGLFIGAIVVLVVVALFLIEEVALLFGEKSPVLAIILGSLGSLIIAASLDYIRRAIFAKSMSKKQRRNIRTTVAGVSAIETAFGLLSSTVAGLCFTTNIGTGVMVLCAMTVVRLVHIIISIERCERAVFTRRAIIGIVVLALTSFVAAAILTYLSTYHIYHHLGVALALATGYLISTMFYGLPSLVEKRKK